MTEPSPARSSTTPETSDASAQARATAPSTSTAAFADLAMVLHGEEDQSVHHVLQRVVGAAERVLPGIDEVSITLLERERATTVVFTGPLANALDERQYEMGFGPCVDAARSGTSVHLWPTAADSPYPDFARIAADHGVTDVLSVGLPVPQGTIGALNLYSCAPGRISDGTAALAETFAGYAAVAIANAQLYQSAVDEAHHMHEAMRTRAVIEQAKGIVMATRRCTPDEAFAVLARASQAQNRKLRDVAADLVARAQT